MNGPYGMPNYYNYPFQPPNFTGYQQVEQPDGFQGISIVPGYEAAVASLVPLNSRVLLMDENAPRFWVKTVNNSGVATLQEYEFKAVEKPADNTGKYVSEEQFSKLQQELNDLKEKYEQSNIREQPVTVTAEPVSDEW